MPTETILGGLNQEVTQQDIKDLIDSMNTLVQFLYANSPRRDAANRMTVNNSEVTQPITGTITNLITVSGQPQQFIGQGVPLHIYDNIKIT